MVFIAIAAVKAAQSARQQYVKDKKRNDMITPVEGSSHLMRQREDDNPNQGSNHWWDGDNPNSTTNHTYTSPEQEHNSQHAVGAWSRDMTLQRKQSQRNEQKQFEQQRPTSMPPPSHSTAILDTATTTTDSSRPVSTPNIPSIPPTSNSTHSQSSSGNLSTFIKQKDKRDATDNTQTIKVDSTAPSTSFTEFISQTADSKVKSNTQSEKDSKSIVVAEHHTNTKQANKQQTKPNAVDGSFHEALRSGNIQPKRPIPRIGEQSQQQQPQQQPNLSQFKSAFGLNGETRKRIAVERQHEKQHQQQPSLQHTTSAFSATGDTRKRAPTSVVSSSSKLESSSIPTTLPPRLASKKTVTLLANKNTTTNSGDTPKSAFKSSGTLKKKVKQPNGVGNASASSSQSQVEHNATTTHKASPTSITAQSSMSAAGTMKKRRSTRPTN